MTLNLLRRTWWVPAMLSLGLLSGCAVQQVGDKRAVTLETGVDVLDATSHVAAGIYLGQPESAAQAKSNAEQVKALDAAIERAKARKNGDNATTTSSGKDQ